MVCSIIYIDIVVFFLCCFAQKTLTLVDFLILKWTMIQKYNKDRIFLFDLT
jgi:hypothetical protein